MNKLLIICCIAYLSVLLVSCDSLDVQTATTDQAVVEGYLYADHLISIKVTKESVYGKDSINIPLSGLQLKVSDGTQEEILMESSSGNYTSQTLTAIAGKTYSLQFTYNNKTLSATTVIPQKPQNFKESANTLAVPSFTGGFGTTAPTIPDPIKLTWTSDMTDYYMVVAQNVNPSASLINDNGDTNRPKRIFRNEPTQSNSNLLDFKNFSYLGMHNIILMKLNAEYAALYKTTDNSSQNLTAPISNITNGLGIFTGINSDTLYVFVYKTSK